MEKTEFKAVFNEMVNTFAGLANVKIEGYVKNNVMGSLDVSTATRMEVRELFTAFMLNYAASYNTDTANVDNIRLFI